MKILNIIFGLACFAVAILFLAMISLIALAWIAQFSNRAAKSSASTVSIMIGHWTLSGWQIYAVLSLLVILTLAFIIGGVSVFRSSKPAA